MLYVRYLLGHFYFVSFIHLCFVFVNYSLFAMLLGRYLVIRDLKWGILSIC